MRSAGTSGRAHFSQRKRIAMGCTEVELRRYRVDDLGAIFRLDALCFSEQFRFDHDSMWAFAQAQNAVTIVAESVEGEVVGFVIAHMERRAGAVLGYVVTLDVAERCRRKGLAKRLMQEAEIRVAAEGAEWMELHVFTGNEQAIRFYERLGYVRIGLSRRFYGKAGLDAFLYRKDLFAL
jgi:[ribosomal protein S18]-alanine N-acetyltransferase